MLPLPPPPFDFQALRPPAPVIEAYGGTRLSPADAFKVAGLNPNVAKWLTDNVDYYSMKVPYQTSWYGQTEPYSARGFYYAPSAIGERPMVLAWEPSPEALSHESLHAYQDNYGFINPGGPRVQDFKGQLRGALLQYNLDPAYRNSLLPWAAWLNKAPKVPESEIFATLPPLAGYRNLPPYLQRFYQGLYA